ncbi:MAG: nuclear transport factor 2 family protein [Deltaproteobacteria bacterium]|nr:nuclear transport factor 2 family protein [Deltaproteobacteria bacterium]MBI3386536.1 nuclear transport factor 2 family protein [Deltaproteobacteria bacterium]
MSSDPHLQLAERLMAAIMAGNVDEVRHIYAPNAVIWHNNDNLEQSVDENLAVLGWVVKHVSNLRYEIIRRQRMDSGFVQQHVLRGTAPNGKPLEVPACLVCTVQDGRITRLDEYLDTAHLAPLVQQ